MTTIRELRTALANTGQPDDARVVVAMRRYTTTASDDVMLEWELRDFDVCLRSTDGTRRGVLVQLEPGDEV